jgi:hypothetical protein
VKKPLSAIFRKLTILFVVMSQASVSAASIASIHQNTNKSNVKAASSAAAMVMLIDFFNTHFSKAVNIQPLYSNYPENGMIISDLNSEKNIQIEYKYEVKNNIRTLGGIIINGVNYPQLALDINNISATLSKTDLLKIDRPSAEKILLNHSREFMIRFSDIIRDNEGWNVKRSLPLSAKLTDRAAKSGIIFTILGTALVLSATPIFVAIQHDASALTSLFALVLGTVLSSAFLYKFIELNKVKSYIYKFAEKVEHLKLQLRKKSIESDNLKQIIVDYLNHRLNIRDHLTSNNNIVQSSNNTVTSIFKNKTRSIDRNKQCIILFRLSSH